MNLLKLKELEISIAKENLSELDTAKYLLGTIILSAIEGFVIKGSDFELLSLITLIAYIGIAAIAIQRIYKLINLSMKRIF